MSTEQPEPLTGMEEIAQIMVDLRETREESPNDKYPKMLGEIMSSAVVGLYSSANPSEVLRSRRLIYGLREEMVQLDKDQGSKFAEMFASFLNERISSEDKSNG